MSMQQQLASGINSNQHVYDFKQLVWKYNVHVDSSALVTLTGFLHTSGHWSHWSGAYLPDHLFQATGMITCLDKLQNGWGLQ